MDYVKIVTCGYLFLAGAIITYIKENNFRFQDVNVLEDMLEQVWHK